MSNQFYTLLKEAQQLPPGELRLLVEALHEALESPESPAGYLGDEEVVQRYLTRREELKSGAKTSISRKELMRRVQANLSS